MVDRLKKAAARRQANIFRQRGIVSESDIKKQQMAYNLETARSEQVARRVKLVEQESRLLNDNISKEKLQEQIIKETERGNFEKAESLKVQMAYLTEINSMSEKQRESLKVQNALEQKKLDLYKSQLEAQKKALGAIAQSSKQLITDVALLGKSVDTSGSLSGFLSGIDTLAKNFTGIKDIIGSLGISGFFKTLNSAASGLSNMFNDVLNFGASAFLKNTLNIVTAMSTARAQMVQFTGSVAELQGEMVGLRNSGGGMLLNFQDAAKAIKALYSESFVYREETRGLRGELGKLVATFQRIGVSGQSISKIIDVQVKALGNLTSEAMGVTKELFGFAKALRVPPEIMMKDYTASIGYLSRYGNASTSIFKRVASLASATGLEMNKLLGIAKGFDTLQGAAQKTAKLNAVLGGPYLNSVKMMSMNEEQRLTYMRERIRLSGKDIDSMNGQAKSALAQAAGFEKVSDFLQFIKTGQKEVNDKTKEAEGASDKQTRAIAQMQAAARSALPLMDRLGRIFERIFSNPEFTRIIESFALSVEKFLMRNMGLFKDFDKTIGTFMKLKLGGILLSMFTGGDGVVSNMKSIGATVFDLIKYATILEVTLGAINNYKAGKDNIFSTIADGLVDTFDAVEDGFYSFYFQIKEIFLSMKMMIEPFMIMQKQKAQDIENTIQMLKTAEDMKAREAKKQGRIIARKSDVEFRVLAEEHVEREGPNMAGRFLKAMTMKAGEKEKLSGLRSEQVALEKDKKARKEYERTRNLPGEMGPTRKLLRGMGDKEDFSSIAGTYVKETFGETAGTFTEILTSLKEGKLAGVDFASIGTMITDKFPNLTDAVTKALPAMQQLGGNILTIFNTDGSGGMGNFFKAQFGKDSPIVKQFETLTNYFKDLFKGGDIVEILNTFTTDLKEKITTAVVEATAERQTTVVVELDGETIAKAVTEDISKSLNNATRALGF